MYMYLRTFACKVGLLVGDACVGLLRCCEQCLMKEFVRWTEGPTRDVALRLFQVCGMFTSTSSAAWRRVRQRRRGKKRGGRWPLVTRSNDHQMKGVVAGVYLKGLVAPSSRVGSWKDNGSTRMSCRLQDQFKEHNLPDVFYSLFFSCSAPRLAWG